MKFIRMFAVAALISVGLTGHVHASNQTITQIVAASGGTFDNNKFDYDILLNAVITAGLADALNDPSSNLTVLAPNDKAFIRLAKDLGFAGNDEEGAWNFLVAALTALGGGDPIPVLTNVLLYHVIPARISIGKFVVFSIFQIPLPTLLEDATITPSIGGLIDNEPDLTNARLTLPVNVRASNGFIHTIDRVLIPIDLP